MTNNRRFIPYNANITSIAKQLRKSMTESERKLWYCYLKDCGVKFYRQKQIEKYILDFYCAKARLVIEVDGDSHFNEDAVKYDKARSKLLENYGLKIMRVTNKDIKCRFSGVCEAIEKIIMPHKSQDTLNPESFL